MEAAQAHLSLHLSKCHIVGNHVSRLKCVIKGMHCNCFYDHLFLQVLNVVKEQITRALDKKQLPPSLENFRQNLSNCSYDHLKQIWEMERKTTEEKEAQARPIVYVCLFVLMLNPSQQFISHVGTFSCHSGWNQY